MLTQKILPDKGFQEASPLKIESQKEIDHFVAYFKLLSEVDQRLRKEDPEYRKKYYPEDQT